MQTFLIDYSGREFELPALLGWQFSYGDELPCDAFEISFVFDGDMLEMLEGAVRFRAAEEGRTVFFGLVDEFDVSVTERGSLVFVCGRSMAALLLDNEAEAAEIYGATLDFVLDKYVYPFGIEKVKKNAAAKMQMFVVKSGASCWSVLEDFLWFSGGVIPRFLPDGTLLIGDEPGKTYALKDSTAAVEQKFKRQRYGVISEVLVKNRVLGASTVARNEEFLAKGGSCRRVVNVPRYTHYDAMRASGDYQIRSSKVGEYLFSFTVPELFAAFPGDVVEVKNSPVGVNGSFVVGRSRCFASADRAGTEIILSGRAN